ncbi:rod shape-determining protein MreD [Flavobacteriaceae bacterium Ap0902]|nr:rod shape-determining protein MreD [Flavobacteriaceae bacterium Ap0902]
MEIANPFVYIIFILLLPLDTNRYLSLFYAFILGIGIDLFEMTGGINAFATVFIAFIRPFLIKVINMGNYEEAENIKLFRFNFLQWILYLFILIFIHHFTVILLEQFNFDFIQRTLTQTVISSTITLIIAGIYIILFPPRRTSEF